MYTHSNYYEDKISTLFNRNKGSQLNNMVHIKYQMLQQNSMKSVKSPCQPHSGDPHTQTSKATNITDSHMILLILVL